MIALIGLGNPGTKHKNNRHNVGYLFIDQLLQDHDDVMREKKFDGELASFLIGKKKIYTFKSNDYMNECGKSIATFLNFFKIKSNLTYVVHDDLDITLGKIKIKLGGSSAGHNGLKSIDSKIGKNYNRIRIGINHPGNKEMVNKHVLSNFKKSELEVINELNIKMSENIKILLDGEKSKFINNLKINGININSSSDIWKIK